MDRNNRFVKSMQNRNVPEGNISVFFTNYEGDYSVKRLENGLEGLVVSFPEAIQKETDITIMVQ